MTKTQVPAFTNWTCKDNCGWTYTAALPINASAHTCPKRNNHHVDSIPDKLDPGACEVMKKRVASPNSNSTNPTKSQEDKDMARATPKTQDTKAAPTEVSADEIEKVGRRSFGDRGWLAVEVDKFLRADKTGEAVPVGTIVKAVTNSAGENPSTGAVAAVVKRWGEQGYCKVKNARPMSFNGFTAKWADSNLDAFLDSQKAKRAKARAAAKATTEG